MKLSMLFIFLLILLNYPETTYAASTGFIKAKNNLCLDIKDGANKDGTVIQLWTCTAGNKNQIWTLDGSQFRSADGKCLDIANGGPNGAYVQLWTCNNNRNQFFSFNASAIENSKLGLCLDVTGGNYQNGQKLQAWECNGGRGNQTFSFAASQNAARNAPAQAAQQGSFYGYKAISIDQFVAKNSMCAWIKDAVVAAAADQGLNATFLAAICIVESSCTVPSNGFGPWQFSDDGAWNQFGGQNKDRQNVWDAAYGAARYFKFLLNQEGGNLDNALRAYNGPLSQGGNPRYSWEVSTWMAGGNAW